MIKLAPDWKTCGPSRTASVRDLVASTGLSISTVSRAIARLILEKRIVRRTAGKGSYADVYEVLDFTVVDAPAGLFARYGLGASAGKVWNHLGGEWVSVADLSRNCGAHPTTIRRALKALASACLAEGKNQSNPTSVINTRWRRCQTCESPDAFMVRSGISQINEDVGKLIALQRSEFRNQLAEQATFERSHQIRERNMAARNNGLGFSQGPYGP
jgi:DNA-binding transcriptional regulator YhcF (GntR family)